LAYCWYSTNNGVTNTTIACGTNVTNLISTEGSNTWIFYANDSLGNTNVTQITFSKDILIPLIQFDVSTESNNSLLTRNNILVNITATDTNLANITIYLYNTTSLVKNVTTVTSPNYFNFTNLPDGQYWFNASAYDLLLNYNRTATLTVTIDTTKPFVNILYPLNTTYTTNVSQLNYTCSESGFAWYSINNGVTNSTIQPCGTNFTNVLSTEGSNTWILYVNDSAGNLNITGAISFAVDSTLPLISYGAGTRADGDSVESNSIYVNVTAFDTEFANVTFRLYNNTGGASFINETTFFTASPFFDITFTNLSNNNVSYLYNVTSYDMAGNLNKTETRTIKLIDITPPNISIESPQNISYDYNVSLALTYIVADTNLNSCWYNLDNKNNVSLTCGTNVSFNVSNGQHTAYLYANDSLNNVNSDNVTFVANSSLILTPDYYVQRGSLALTNAANATLSIKADKTKSFIMLNTRSASSTPDILQVSANYTNSTLMSFYNYAGSANVEWESISGPKLNVQRGVQTAVAGNVNFNITISPVNLSSSFIIVQDRLNTATANQYIRGMWTGVFRNSTQIQLQRDTTGTAGEVSWQVVDWAGATVQNGTTALAAVSTFVNLPNNVSTDRSFLVFSTRAVTSTNANSLFGNGRLMNSTTLQLHRGSGAAGTLTYSWFVISDDDIRVDRGMFAMGAVSSANVSIPAPVLVNMSKAFRATSQNCSGSVATYTNAHVTTYITNLTNLRLDKGGTAQSNVVSWQTIEFIDRTSPVVNLYLPVDNANFSSYVINSFNYSVSDNSSVINCSLLGNWTGSFAVNQTVLNPNEDIMNNFSQVNVTNDGYYIWNVKCYDIYGNIGTNSTNYTFAAFLPSYSPALQNVNQSSNDGTGNVTLSWASAPHAAAYNVYYSTNLSTFVFLNRTSNLNYTDTSFVGNQRRYYYVSAWNPTLENYSGQFFSAHVYTLSKNVNTRNWIGLPTNASYLKTANDTLYEIRNITAVSMLNSTTQKEVTCNTYSCPVFPSCTDTNCNFGLSPGAGYEVNLNSSVSSSINWSVVGMVYSNFSIVLNKNATGTGKNWIAMYANTTLMNAQAIIGNISNTDAVTKWDSVSQKSVGLIPSPFPFGAKFIGTNFNTLPEAGYEVSVNQTLTWNQK
jgi:hypothetical protein